MKVKSLLCCLLVAGLFSPAFSQTSGGGNTGDLPGWIPPPPPTERYGRPAFFIHPSTPKDTAKAIFLQAVAVGNADVHLEDGVDLDLTGEAADHPIWIAGGVHILGGRSATNLGPRIWTSSKPAHLFSIRFNNNDGVLIHGIRLDGMEQDVESSDGSQCHGIDIDSRTNIEISNCEIYGWSGLAVGVTDSDADGEDRLNLSNPTSVWIHDNYIHDNRHWSTFGYGVAVGNGAYALIERNVFDYNRHSITAGGQPGTGYLAHDNLILEGGGWEKDLFLGTYRTHVIDVHGTRPDSLGRDFYAGPAGEYFEIDRNTILYDGSDGITNFSGDVLKVRGYPSNSARVRDNVFVHEQEDAIVQTDGNNLYQSGNKFSVPVGLIYGAGGAAANDFVGTGYGHDQLMALGAGMWFKSYTTGQWHFLNPSTKTRNDIIEIADFNHDGRADIKVSGDADGQPIIFSGGGPKRLVFPPTHPNGIEVTPKVANLYWQDQGSHVVSGLKVRNGEVIGNISVNIGDRTLLGTGDFNGDGIPDWVLKDPTGQVFTVLLDEAGGIYPNVPRSTWVNPVGMVPSDGSVMGIGDFNGDGRDDILWRHSDGQLEIWFAGANGNSALVNHPDYPAGAPASSPWTTPTTWQVKGIGDFNGDGFSDIYWRCDDGRSAIWSMAHGVLVNETFFGSPDPNHYWNVSAFGDFDGDGRCDILFRNTDGGLLIHFGNGSEAVPTYQNLGGHPGLDAQVQAVMDTNGDGLADIVWRNASGATDVWLMDGASMVLHRLSGATLAATPKVDGRIELFGLDINPSYAGATADFWAFSASQATVNGSEYNPWQPVNGRLTSVAAGSFGQNVYGNNQNLLIGTYQPDADHIWYTRERPYFYAVPSSYDGWHSVDGHMASIAVTKDVHQEVVLFGAARDGSVWRRASTSTTYNLYPAQTTWGAWKQFPNAVLQVVMAATNSSNLMQVFGFDSYGNFWTSYQTNVFLDTWSDFIPLGNNIMAASVAKHSDGRLELFAIDRNTGHLLHAWQASPGSVLAWSGWYEVSSGQFSQVASSAQGDGRICVFVVDLLGNVFTATETAYNSEVYGALTQIPGKIHP